MAAGGRVQGAESPGPLKGLAVPTSPSGSASTPAHPEAPLLGSLPAAQHQCPVSRRAYLGMPRVPSCISGDALHPAVRIWGPGVELPTRQLLGQRVFAGHSRASTGRQAHCR